MIFKADIKGTVAHGQLDQKDDGSIAVDVSKYQHAKGQTAMGKNALRGLEGEKCAVYKPHLVVLVKSLLLPVVDWS